MICTSLPFHFNLLIPAGLSAIALSYLPYGKEENPALLPFENFHLLSPSAAFLSLFFSSYCILNLAGYSTWQALLFQKWHL